MVDFSLPAHQVAQQLIGYELRYTNAAETAGGIIVETEAYEALDPASHSFKGQTRRNAAMFDGPGTLYIYQIYGMHYCLNIVTGNHDGQAVLIRALEPTIGVAYMEQRMRHHDIRKLCNGPAKLVKALGLTLELSGSHFAEAGIDLQPASRPVTVKTSGRIGISQAREVLWRFFAADSPYTTTYR